MISVLFVDDDHDLRTATAQTLSLEGMKVTTASRADEALSRVIEGFEGVIVTDIRMPGTDGLELLRLLMERDGELPVILVSGHADVPMAVGALRRGAYDVLEKPFAVDQLIASIERAAERRNLVLENRRLREVVPSLGTGALLGRSPAIEQLRRTIAQVAPVAVDVLIEGETGTGKGVVAAMLHTISRRRGPMVTVDCGALPAGLFEAEVFGHVADAVPGSRMPRTGRIEQAHRGTLFLDEVEAMAEQVQLKMQVVLERRQATPVGGTTPKALDFRILSASGADLEGLARDGRFRAPFLYRLNGITLRLPPLRERREDILPLFRTFAVQAAERLGLTPPTLDTRTFRHLERHDWPGNVRELMRFAENLVLGLTDADPRDDAAVTAGNLKARVDRFETELIEEALFRSNGDVRRTCAALDLPRKTFYYKAKRLGIDLSPFRHTNG